MRDPLAWDYWVCDECHRTFPRATMSQNTVRVQQQTRHIWEADVSYREVHQLTVCDTCLRGYRDAR